VTTVDARGLACPLPLTLAKREMARLDPGDELLVLATDPEAPLDLAAWAAKEGHALVERPQPDWTELELRKRPADRESG
jgi:tRNA 2-thiouridine synthesizing protein A